MLFDKSTSVEVRMKSASLLVELIITSKSLLIPMMWLLISPVGAQVIPTWFTFPSTSQPVNGSSATGLCTGATRLSDRYQCNDPTSSVVYDGHIPTLTGLDGNMWASQLLTINASSAVLVSDFTGTPNFQVERVEFVVFNCPKWGISVRSVDLRNTQLTLLGNVNPTLSSCDSLIRVYIIPNFCTPHSQAELIIEFTTLKPTDWIHIAEVVFYAHNHTGPLEMIINEPTTVCTTTTKHTADTTASIETGKTTADTTTQAGPDNTMMSMTQSTDTTANMTHSPDGSTMSTTHSASCSTSTILASVITAITIALLATFIFVLLQIALCKCHPKFTQGKLKSAASTEGEGLAVYEQVNEGKGYVAMRDDTYMETGTGKVNVINIKRNEAYGTNYKQVK